MNQITQSYLKFTSKLQKKESVVDFVATLKTARSVLVFMPDKLDDFGIALKFVKNIKGCFSNASIHLCTKDAYQNLLENKSKIGTIFVAREDVNAFGMPKRKLLHKIMATKYDVIIELNQDFFPFSTYITQKSEAALKICLDQSEREPYFNFCFRTLQDTTLEEKYKKLFKYISKFTAPVKHV